MYFPDGKRRNSNSGFSPFCTKADMKGKEKCGLSGAKDEEE
jgi:hypothetical protein